MVVSGESASADILTDISTTGLADGDLLWLVEGSNGDDITVTDTGNITIVDSIDFLIDGAGKSILLRYSLSDNAFTEVMRTAVSLVTVAGMRTASIPEPVSGTETKTFATGGGTESRTPGTDKGYLICLGSGTLSSSWTIEGDGSPIDGDTWYIDYRATLTANGNDFTILTVSNSVTSANTCILCTNNSDSPNNHRFQIVNDRRTNKQQVSIVGTSGSINQLTLVQQDHADQKMSATVVTATEVSGYYNGTFQTTETLSGVYANVALQIGVSRTTKIGLKGTIQEIPIFPSDKTSDLTELHSDIDTYYSIP